MKRFVKADVIAVGAHRQRWRRTKRRVASPSASVTSVLVGAVRGWHFQLPLAVVLVALVFACTALIGGIVAFMAISQSTTVALQLADDLDLSLLTIASALVKNMLQLVVNSTVDLANDYEMTRLKRMAMQSSRLEFLSVTGLYFHTAANGSQALAYLKLGALEIDWQDQSLNGSFINVDGQVVFSNACGTILHPPGIADSPERTNGYWIQPASYIVDGTYSIGYRLPVWNGLQAGGAPGAAGAHAAVYTLLFTTRSLDAYLRTIPTTPNAVLALVDGHTGMVLGVSAVSAAGVSESWPSQLSAVGNPNGMVSAAAAQLVGQYTNGSVAKNETASIGLIADRTSQFLKFAYAGTRDLSMLLMLVMPSADLLGQLGTTTRNTIVFVVVFDALAFGTGAVVAWVMTVPLRRVTVVIKQ
ncbi:hypothetical protein HK405_004178, partial [Cladochytrium tenue]